MLTAQHRLARICVKLRKITLNPLATNKLSVVEDDSVYDLKKNKGNNYYKMLAKSNLLKGTSRSPKHGCSVPNDPYYKFLFNIFCDQGF